MAMIVMNIDVILNVINRKTETYQRILNFRIYGMYNIEIDCLKSLPFMAKRIRDDLTTFLKQLYDLGHYQEALTIFTKIYNYKSAAHLWNQCIKQLMGNGVNTNND